MFAAGPRCRPSCHRQLYVDDDQLAPTTRNRENGDRSAYAWRLFRPLLLLLLLPLAGCCRLLLLLLLLLPFLFSPPSIPSSPSPPPLATGPRALLRVAVAVVYMHAPVLFPGVFSFSRVKRRRRRQPATPRRAAAAVAAETRTRPRGNEWNWGEGDGGGQQTSRQAGRPAGRKRSVYRERKADFAAWLTRPRSTIDSDWVLAKSASLEKEREREKTLITGSSFLLDDTARRTTYTARRRLSSTFEQKRTFLRVALSLSPRLYSRVYPFLLLACKKVSSYLRWYPSFAGFLTRTHAPRMHEPRPVLERSNPATSERKTGAPGASARFPDPAAAEPVPSRASARARTRDETRLEPTRARAIWIANRRRPPTLRIVQIGREKWSRSFEFYSLLFSLSCIFLIMYNICACVCVWIIFIYLHNILYLQIRRCVYYLYLLFLHRLFFLLNFCIWFFSFHFELNKKSIYLTIQY